MSNDDTKNQERRIADIRDALNLSLPDSIRQQLETELRTLISFGNGNQFGDVKVGDVAGGDVHKGNEGSVNLNADARLAGAAVGVNLGTIQTFFGSTPPLEAKELARNYFEMLIARYDSIRLSRLLGAEQTGKEQPSAPSVSLVEVFISLTTNYRVPAEPLPENANAILATLDAANPAVVLPPQVCLAELNTHSTQSQRSLYPKSSSVDLATHWLRTRQHIVALVENRQSFSGFWYYPELLTEAIAKHTRLIVIGDPGSGKSTVLRYLTVRLAKALSTGATQVDLPGWEQIENLPIPFFCSLSQVVQRFDDNVDTDKSHLEAVLLSPINETIRQGLRDTVLSAMRRGRALILLDGLDEVPNTREEVRQGQTKVLQSRRERIIAAIAEFSTDIGKSCIVITCRKKPFEDLVANSFSEDWKVRTVEPFSFGQVRTFLNKWYEQSCLNPETAKYSLEDIPERVNNIIADLKRLPKLQELATSPLLLTMLALLHYNQTRLPEQRAEVCEALVELLLERWELVRSAYDGQRLRWQSLGDLLGLSSLTREDLSAIRSIVHRQAYEAHKQKPEGLGSITNEKLRKDLDLLFAKKLNPNSRNSFNRSTYVDTSDRFLKFITKEAGLLFPEGEEDGLETYALPHLILQEYLAACFLAEQQACVIQAIRLWRTNAERWREPLLLLVVRLLHLTKVYEIKDWLNKLLELTDNKELPLSTRLENLAFLKANYESLGGRGGMYLFLRRVNDLPTENSLPYQEDNSALQDENEQYLDNLEQRMNEVRQDLMIKQSDFELSRAQTIDQQEALAEYLTRLSAALDYIPLHRLDGRSGKSNVLPLSNAYIALSTNSLLATEAVLRFPRLIILGDPGSGKSTLLRYLAWSYAQRALGKDTSVSETLNLTNFVPLLISMRTLAGRLDLGESVTTAVYATLNAEIQRYSLQPVDSILMDALLQGTVLLLLDALDEVPGDDSRHQVLQAVQLFGSIFPMISIVVTSRTLGFNPQYLSSNWAIETLSPFTTGQIRQFVAAWYRELVTSGQITEAQAESLSRKLVDTIAANQHLRAMADNPLLLTLMAVVHFNSGALPFDRSKLYESILELLLGQWDKVREGTTLPEAIGLPDWESVRFMPVLDKLAYMTHLTGISSDGRSHLSRNDIYITLIDFFSEAQVPLPREAALRWLDYVEQRSGLLVSEGDDSYVFAHLTLQEHCVGRYIALNSEDPVALVLEHRADDRWREPIFLGASLMHPAVLNALLTDLIEGEGKDTTRWYRDLILAAEIGNDRDWSYLRTRPMLKVDRLQFNLRQGLMALLNDANQPLPATERLQASFLLGELDK